MLKAWLARNRCSRVITNALQAYVRSRKGLLMRRLEVEVVSRPLVWRALLTKAFVGRWLIQPDDDCMSADTMSYSTRPGRLLKRLRGTSRSALRVLGLGFGTAFTRTDEAEKDDVLSDVLAIAAKALGIERAELSTFDRIDGLARVRGFGNDRIAHHPSRCEPLYRAAEPSVSRHHARSAIRRLVAAGRARPTPRHWMRGGTKMTAGLTFVYWVERPDICALVRDEAVVTILSRRTAAHRLEVVSGNLPRPVYGGADPNHERTAPGHRLGLDRGRLRLANCRSAATSRQSFGTLRVTG